MKFLIEHEPFPPEQLDIAGAILLTVTEAKTLMSNDQRKYPCAWWLRADKPNEMALPFVYSNGDVGEKGLGTYFDAAAIRPALVIRNMSETRFRVGESFLLDGKYFRIISPTRALMAGDLGIKKFADRNSSYENSNARQLVHDWFESVCCLFGTYK